MATTTHSPMIRTAKKFKVALAMCRFILRFLHHDVHAGEAQPQCPSRSPANAIGWRGVVPFDAIPAIDEDGDEFVEVPHVFVSCTAGHSFKYGWR